MGLEFGVIADDLTGGLIVAGMLEREGVACPLATCADLTPSANDDGALVIARRFRLSTAHVPEKCGRFSDKDRLGIKGIEHFR